MHNCRYDPIKEFGLNFWEMWKYWGYNKRYLFPIPAFTKKIRVIVKECLFFYYGMRHIVPLVRAHGYGYQYRSAESGNDFCIVGLNGPWYNWHTEGPVVLQECANAISNGDAREAWILYQHAERIWNLVTGRCMQVTLPDKNIVVGKCKNNYKDKWI